MDQRTGDIVSASKGRTGRRPGFGLSERLLLLTVVFVLAAEALIYVPSLANFRTQWLRGRVQSAEIALLALGDAGDEISADFEATLLGGVGVLGVEAVGGPAVGGPAVGGPVERGAGLRLGVLPEADVLVDLRRGDAPGAIIHALSALNPPGDRLIAVTDAANHIPSDRVRMVVRERELSFALRDYSHNILWLSGVISLITGLLVFVACRVVFVGPIARLSQRLSAVRDDPEGFEPGQASRGRDEVAAAERALVDMQTEVRRALGQRRRLARLGEAVAKISHDLSNILTSAQMITDRLQSSRDPDVARMAPRLVNAIDRAVSLCVQTLNYTGAEEPAPVRSATDLSALAHEALETAGFTCSGPFRMTIEDSADVAVNVDPTQMFRIMLNLSRNALQAMKRHGREAGEMRVRAAPLRQDAVMIDMADDGPGVPAHVREELFRPFTKRAAGSGLGLSIARELARRHGGEVCLVETGPTGATFRIVIADAFPAD